MPALPPARARGVMLATCGLVITACVAAWSWQGDQTTRVGSFLSLYGLAFAAYLGALLASRGLDRRRLTLALGAAVAWRVFLVAAAPLLSNDVNRSVWEGRVQLHGGNPYRWADRPEAPQWVPLRDEVWRDLNHRDYTAVYPPLWQLACRLVVAVSDTVTAIKAFLALCELATLGLLARLLARRRLPAERLLVLAWNPLALVEIAGSGHNEALGMLLLVAALLLLELDRPLPSAIATALGVQAKLLPGLVAVAWARRYRPLHGLAALASAALLVVPYAGAGRGLVRSLGHYGTFWRFNETLFAPVAMVLGHAAAVRVSFLGALAVAAWLGWRRTEPAAAALVVVSATLALSPNVLPWYGLWLLPLLVVREAPALLLLSGTLPLAYLVYPVWYAGDAWRLGWDVRLLEYGPVVAVAVWDQLRSGSRR